MTSGPTPSHVAPSCVQMWPDEWVNRDHRAREYPVTRLRLLIAFRTVRSGVAGATSGVKQAAKVRWEYGRRFGCRVIQSGHRARSRRHVKTTDFDADSMTSFELVSRRQQLDFILDDLARRNRFDRILRQFVEGFCGPGSIRIRCPVRRLNQPRVSSRSGNVSGTARSPTRAVTAATSGPTSFSTTSQFVSD
jgi:hypothetical protein